MNPTSVNSFPNPVSSYSYDYDSRGNITSIKEDGIVMVSYQYDEQSQLLREDNKYIDRIFTYVYDAGGNIKSKSEWNYSNGSWIDTIYYIYDTVGKDKLLSYDGKGTITYDGIGYPMTYYKGANTYAFEWEGRQLTNCNINGLNIVSLTCMTQTVLEHKRMVI